ncbi:MAG: hypothetical protein R3B56_05620 [Candidatus Scalinduaceae bacterium]
MECFARGGQECREECSVNHNESRHGVLRGISKGGKDIRKAG